MTGKSWMGSIEGIELDWHEGVFVETLASPQPLIQTVHGPMLSDQPTGVYYDAKCCCCEWAYELRTGMAEPIVRAHGQDVSYGYRTPDLEEMLGWTGNHRAKDYHKRAVANFRRIKGQMNSEKKGQ